MQKNAIQRRGHGFTLIELIAVIAIIAILAAFSVGVFQYAGQKGDNMTAVGDLEKIADELEEYKSQYGFYPSESLAETLDPWGEPYIYYPVLPDGTVVSNQLILSQAPVGYQLFSYGGDRYDSNRWIFRNR